MGKVAETSKDGYKRQLEVYDEDPMEVVDNVPVKKEGVEALFKIFTDGNGKYEGKMNIPTSVAVSYTHLDVYKRQLLRPVSLTRTSWDRNIMT